jgi:translation elongation factor EF-4
LRIGDRIATHATGKRYEVTELGLMHPEEETTGSLQAGQVGYLGGSLEFCAQHHR